MVVYKIDNINVLNSKQLRGILRAFNKETEYKKLDMTKKKDLVKLVDGMFNVEYDTDKGLIVNMKNIDDNNNSDIKTKVESNAVDKIVNNYEKTNIERPISKKNVLDVMDELFHTINILRKMKGNVKDFGKKNMKQLLDGLTYVKNIDFGDIRGIKTSRVYQKLNRFNIPENWIKLVSS